MALYPDLSVRRQCELLGPTRSNVYYRPADDRRVERAGAAVSMDGRGRCLDNVFVERLWRGVTYEDGYLRGYESAPELEWGLTAYFGLYNTERPHQSHDYRTPAEVHAGRQ